MNWIHDRNDTSQSISCNLLTICTQLQRVHPTSKKSFGFWTTTWESILSSITQLVRSSKINKLWSKNLDECRYLNLRVWPPTNQTSLGVGRTSYSCLNLAWVSNIPTTTTFFNYYLPLILIEAMFWRLFLGCW